MLDERRRHAMIESFIETNGEDAAMALADSIFSIDHATKADLERFPTKAELKAELRAEVAKLATKDELKAELKAAIAELPTEARLERALRSQSRWYLTGVTGCIAAATALNLIFG